jgi:hypothetical protein
MVRRVRKEVFTVLMPNSGTYNFIEVSVWISLTKEKGYGFLSGFSSFSFYSVQELNCRNCKRLREFKEI